MVKMSGELVDPEGVVYDDSHEGGEDEILDDTGGQEFQAIDGQDEGKDSEPEQPASGGDDRDSPGILDEIAEAESLCSVAQWRVALAREELKAAKAEYDESVLKLRRLAESVRRDADRPLFKQPPVAEAATAEGDQPTNSVESANQDENDWRDALIAELDLPGSVSDKLDQHGIYTIGDLEDLRTDIANGKAKWPKGIGQAKVTQIEDAVVEWLASWHKQQEATGGTTKAKP